MRSIYEDLADKAADNSELVSLATIAVEKFDDRKWAEKLLAQAEEKSEQMNDYSLVAGAVFHSLKDRQQTETLYNKAEKLCNTRQDYSRLLWLIKQQTGEQDMLVSVISQADDAETAVGLYQDAEKKAKSNAMLSSLATSLQTFLDDTQWSSRVLRRIQ